MPTNLTDEAILNGFKETPSIRGLIADGKAILDQPRAKAFVRISKFLTDGPQFIAALKDLEMAMTIEFKSRLANSSVDDYRKGTEELSAPGGKQGMFAHRRSNAYELDQDPTRHLLTEVLNTYLKSEGFTNFDRNADGVIVGPSAYGNIEHAFGEQIQKGRIVKDYVGLDHGEFTHMIQWYCVGNQKVFLELPSNGFDPVVNLFKVSGIFWGPVFDLNQASGEEDFRKPEKLYPWLCDPLRAVDYPLLNGFLVSRRERLDERAYSPARMKLILARKLGGLKPPNGYLKMNNNECDLEYLKNPELVRTNVENFLRLDKPNRNNKVLGSNWQPLPKVVKG